MAAYRGDLGLKLVLLSDGAQRLLGLLLPALLEQPPAPTTTPQSKHGVNTSIPHTKTHTTKQARAQHKHTIYEDTWRIESYHTHSVVLNLWPHAPKTLPYRELYK